MSETSRSSHHSYDQTLKRMLSQEPNSLAALYDPDLAVTAELPGELPASQGQADIVWEVTRIGGFESRCGERLFYPQASSGDRRP